MNIKFNNHYPDVFCTAHNGVSFHKINFISGGNCENNFNELQTTKFLTKDVENQDVKCMEWHPFEEHSNIIALGQTNGRVLLRSTGIESEKVSLMAGKEFQSKNQKSCSDLAWNPFLPSWLAVGLERHGRQNCIAVWDVLAKSSFEAYQGTMERTRVTNDATTAPNLLPIVEYGSAESCDSITWTGGTENKLLLAGMNKKSLRLFDVRSSLSMQSSIINHKTTFGICVDPTFTNRVASFSENIIAFWDMRSFVKPVITVEAPHNIRKIEWNSTRCGMLAAMYSASDQSSVSRTSSMLVYDMLNTIAQDSGRPTVRNVPLKFPDGDWINGFAWHPTTPSSLLVSSSAHSFYLSTVTERTLVSWRGGRNVALVCGNETYTGSNLEETILRTKFDHLIDLTDIFKRRAQNQYGLTDDANQNIELSLQPNNIHLCNMWRLFDIARKLQSLDSQLAQTPQINSPQSNTGWGARNAHKQPLLRSGSRPKPPKNVYTSGILSLLKDDTESSGEPNPRSSPETVDWIGVSATKTTVHRSKKRNLALALCGWCDLNHATSIGVIAEKRFGAKGIGEKLVRNFRQSGSTLRACAIALWHMDMRLAIEVLHSSQLDASIDDRHSLATVAMALSGYAGTNSSTLWLETCRPLQNTLTNPYLKATFAFLLANAEETKFDDKTGHYDAVLNNKDLLIQDRVAFACLFLPDDQLDSYLATICKDSISHGTLDRLLVCGVGTEAGVALLQAYLDKTLDCQTALCAVMQTRDRALLHTNTVMHWKDSYTQLLNRWQLYNERVHFDMIWSKAIAARKPNTQIFIYCNYCNKSISNASKVAEAEKHHRPRAHSSSCVTGSPKKSQGVHKSISTPKRMSHAIQLLSTPKKSPQSTVFQKCAMLFSPVRRSDREFSLVTSTQAEESLEKIKAAAPKKLSASFTRGRNMFVGNLAMQSPVTSCPSCRKPLARCSVCSMHVGTRPLETDFDQWSSWCMKCKHGGHQGHLLEWFRYSKQCPVSDCKCYCEANSPALLDEG